MAAKTDVDKILDKLDKEDMHGQMERLFGQPYEKAKALKAERFADVGFEGAKGGAKVNRLGWTVSNVKWLIDNGEAVDSVIADGRDIADKFSNVVFCGMGGSGLSVQAVKSSFGEGKVRIFSLRTTDPAVLADIVSDISKDAESLEEGLKRTLIIPISKSGTTQETVSHKRYFEQLYAKCGLDIKSHMWVITDKGSPMDAGQCVQREIQLNGKGDIGGRFTSPTTRVFLLPLALTQPEAVWDVLRQAYEMNDAKGLKDDVFIRLGASLFHLARDLGKDKVTFIVPDEFRDLPMWAEQLFEESLGKGGKGLSVFYGERLHPDTLKPPKESDRIFIRVNIGGKTVENALWRHLKHHDYPVYELDARDRNSLGGLMLGLERAVATIAYLWNICFVDQPAVEGYKEATRKVMAAGGKPGIPDEWTTDSAASGSLRLYFGPLLQSGGMDRDTLEKATRHLGTMDDPAAVYAAIIRTLSKKKAGFEAVELASYGRLGRGTRKSLEWMRYELFSKGLRLPSKFGEGPDKNHSYQQNIEDGKNMFFSTYLMPLKVRQPRMLPYDDSLLKAQTIGTVNSMVRNKRKVVLISFVEESEVVEFFREVGTCLEWMD